MKKRFLKSGVSIATICTLSTNIVLANGINENTAQVKDNSKDIVSEEFLTEVEKSRNG